MLVVENEWAICQAITRLLSRDGYRVLSAGTGEDAERLLRTEPVTLLLLDLHLPDVRGDVLYHIATSVRPALAHHTLFMTGDITESAAALIMACGAPMLLKPFGSEALYRSVDMLLATRREANGG